MTDDIFDLDYWNAVDLAVQRWQCWFKDERTGAKCGVRPVGQLGLCKKHLGLV